MRDLTVVDGREKFDPFHPPYGGVPGAVVFSDSEVAVIEAAADQIVPGGDGFPTPSEIGIVAFIAKYVTPVGEPAVHYPCAAEAEFKAALGGLGAAFVSSDGAAQVARLEQVERDEPAFFAQLKELVYYGYYASHEVTSAINRTLEAGRDYRSPAQPYGYADVIEEWPQELLDRVEGEYLRTEDVKPLEGVGV
jgi:hypothetical protein